MMKVFKAILLIGLFATLGSTTAFASGDEEELDAVHHTVDGYYLDFEPFGKVELPRIFLVRRADGSLGVDLFGSTAAALHSGQYRPEVHIGESGADVAHEDAEGLGTDVEAAIGEGAGHDTAAEDETLAELTSSGLVASGAHLDVHLVPVAGSVIIDFSITRHLIFAILASLIVALIFISMARRYQRGIGRDTAPKGLWQNLTETLVVYVRDEIAKPNLGDKYHKFMPFLLTAFFFILVSNLLGLVPYGATATSNLMITAVLAGFTFVMTQFNGSRDHWMHVFWPPGVPFLVKFILIPVEIMGLFAKPVALAIRLFANMTAGHLVILSLIGLIFSFNNIFGAGAGWGVVPVSVAFALFVSVLEILIAFIQAYVFTILSALFIGMAVEEHHHGHEHVEGHLPELTGEDNSIVTPHLISGGNGEEMEAATHVKTPVPVTA